MPQVNCYFGEIRVFGHTLVPNPFWGGALFPLVVFGVMFAWPALERKITGDHRRHDLLDRGQSLGAIETASGTAAIKLISSELAPFDSSGGSTFAIKQ